MVPKDKVVSCVPEDPIEKAMKLMLEHVVGSIIVVTNEGAPAGIVTKTDLIRGWEKGLDAKNATVSEVMGTTIETILDTSPTGVAAEHFRKEEAPSCLCRRQGWYLRGNRDGLRHCRGNGPRQQGLALRQSRRSCREVQSPDACPLKLF